MKRDSESFSGSGTIPSWDLLNKNQKKIINDLVKEFVKINARQQSKEEGSC